MKTHRDNPDVLRHIIKNNSERLLRIIVSRVGLSGKDLFFSSPIFFFREQMETGREEIDSFEGIDDPTLRVQMQHEMLSSRARITDQDSNLLKIGAVWLRPVKILLTKRRRGSEGCMSSAIVCVCVCVCVCVSRITIKLDRLIVLSESSLLGWFFHVSLIVIIKGRSPMEVSLIVIIKQVWAWLSSLFHHFSPNLSKSAHDSPDQTDDMIKIYIIFEVPTPPYGVSLTHSVVWHGAERYFSPSGDKARSSLYCSWKTVWWSQENHYGQDAGNHIENRNEYQIADLWWQRSLHPMMKVHTGNGSDLRWVGGW